MPYKAAPRIYLSICDFIYKDAKMHEAYVRLLSFFRQDKRGTFVRGGEERFLFSSKLTSFSFREKDNA